MTRSEMERCFRLLSLQECGSAPSTPDQTAFEGRSCLPSASGSKLTWCGGGVISTGLQASLSVVFP